MVEDNGDVAVDPLQDLSDSAIKLEVFSPELTAEMTAGIEGGIMAPSGR